MILIYIYISSNIADTNKIRVVELPIIDGINPQPPYMPQAIPQDLAARLIRISDQPFAWWVGQFLKYLLRPQPALAVELEEMKERLAFQSPIVGYVYK